MYQTTKDRRENQHKHFQRTTIFLLTVNIQKLTKIKNVTLVAKLIFVKQKIKY